MVEETKKEEQTPEFPDNESKEIQEEINKDKEEKEETPETPETPVEKKPEEKEETGTEEKKDEKPEEGKPEEGKPEESKEEEPEKPKRTPKTMDVYEHKIAEKKWGKKEEGYKTQILDLETKLKGKDDIEDNAEKIEKFCEKTGMDKETVIGLLGLIPRGGDTSALEKKIADLSEKLAGKDDIQIFNKDFEDTITPKFLEEAKVPVENRAAIKKLIQQFAYTQKYASYNLDDLFFVLKRKGELDDLIKEKGKKSGESSRSGLHGKTEDGEKKKIMDMTDEEFDQYCKDQEKGEKKFQIRRDGEPVK